MKNKGCSRVQVTCICKAYKFPHRVGGGKCSGSEWVESYLMLYGECCQHCNYFRGVNQCDVIDGRECIEECDAYQQELRNSQLVKLPVSLNEFCENLWLCEHE